MSKIFNNLEVFGTGDTSSSSVLLLKTSGGTTNFDFKDGGDLFVRNSLSATTIYSGSTNLYDVFLYGTPGLQAVTNISGVTTNDIEVSDFTKGIILRSPDNNRWRITVDNTGSLITNLI